MRNFHARLILLGALLSPLTLLQAQTAGFTGLVFDPSGGLIPNAKVTISNTATQVSRQVSSNGEGRFDVVGLEAGSYRVRAEKAGFQAYEESGLILPVDTIRRADIAMVPGSPSQVVNVLADAAPLQVDSPETSTSITSAKYDSLPLVQAGRLRNPASFVYLAPGVQGNIRLDGNEYTGATNVIAVHGGNIWGTELLIEGLPGGQTRIVGNYTESSPSVDAVHEFKITTSLLAADYGHTGAAVGSFGIKSGGNQVHGSVYEYLRNDVLDANNWLANASGKARPASKQNEFGGTLGGPIWIPGVYNGRNQTFFFFGYGGSRKSGVDAFSSATIPDARQLAGDFSGTAIKIYDPASTAPNPNGTGFVRTAFAGNVIPLNRQDPVARKIAALYPAPNAAGVNNYAAFTGEKSLNPDTYTAKLDHQLTSRQSLTAAYVRTYIPRFRADSPLPDPFTAGIHQLVGSHTARVGHDLALSSSSINQLRLGYNRFTNYQDPLNPSNTFPQQLGLTGLTGGSFPSISFTGYATIGNITRSIQAENDYYVRDTYRLSIGRHALRVGGEFRKTQYNDLTPYQQTYSIAFNSLGTANPQATANTGNGFASFLLGQVNNATVTNPFSIYTRKNYGGVFGQDDWRVNSRLTLNIGLRAEWSFAPNEKRGRSSIADLELANPTAGNLPGAVRYGGDLFPQGSVGIGPRFGFAYSLTNKTVIRGGYGIYYSDILPNTALPTTGYQSVATFQTPNNGVTAAFLLAGGVPPTNVNPVRTPGLLNGQNANYYNANVGDMPRTQQWSINVQRQLTSSIVLEAVYVGNKSDHQAAPQLDNINQVDPKYLVLGTLLTQPANSAAAAAAGVKLPYAGFTGSVAQALRAYPQFLTLTSVAAKDGFSNYNAFEIVLRDRFSHGLSLDAHYTYSRAKGYANSTLNGNSGVDNILQNAFDRTSEASLLPQDVPHAFVLNWRYELPFARLLPAGRATKMIAGGWALSGVHRYQTGFPLSITTRNTLGIFNRVLRPNLDPSIDPSTHISNNHFNPFMNSVFNKAAFSQPVNSFGNAKPTYDNLRNFPVLSEDFALTKQTQIYERVRWSIYIQAFNAFNRHRFAGINTNFSDAAFGVPSATSQARQVQFGTRVEF